MLLVILNNCFYLLWGTVTTEHCVFAQILFVVMETASLLSFLLQNDCRKCYLKCSPAKKGGKVNSNNTWLFLLYDMKMFEIKSVSNDDWATSLSPVNALNKKGTIVEVCKLKGKSIMDYSILQSSNRVFGIRGFLIWWLHERWNAEFTKVESWI